MDINKKIEELKIVPVVVLQDEKDAEPLAKALTAGGLPVAEVTFRTDAQRRLSERLRQISGYAGGRRHGDVCGPGKTRHGRGGQILVTAGFNRSVTEYAVKNEIPIFPGVCTPSELMLLLE